MLKFAPAARLVIISHRAGIARGMLTNLARKMKANAFPAVDLCPLVALVAGIQHCAFVMKKSMS